MELTEENVLKVLAELGSNPDEIAKNLETKGIRGYRKGGLDCPIANYLMQQFPQCQVSVSGFIWFFDVNQVETTLLQVAIPSPIHVFIQRFDYDGAYPTLAW